MEIERDVKIQIVESEKDPKGSLKAGFSTGSHASQRLPAYSRRERRQNLGLSAVRNIYSALGNKIPLRGGW